MRQPIQVLVLPYRYTDSSFEFLLLRRSESSIWQGVSGGVEGDENNGEAANRELMEETALRPISILALDTKASIPKNIYPDHVHWPKELLVVTEHSFAALVEGEPVLSEEHTDYGWFDIKSAIKKATFDSNRTALWELHERINHV